MTKTPTKARAAPRSGRSPVSTETRWRLDLMRDAGLTQTAVALACRVSNATVHDTIYAKYKNQRVASYIAARLGRRVTTLWPDVRGHWVGGYED